MNFGRTWDGRDGKTRFVFEITFGDGLSGEANAMSNPPPYNTGEKVWYKVNKEHNGIPQVSVKTSDPSQFQNGGNRGGGGFKRNEEEIVAQFCVREAIQLCNVTDFGGKDNIVDRVEYIGNVAKGIADQVKELTEYIKTNK